MPMRTASLQVVAKEVRLAALGPAEVWVAASISDAAWLIITQSDVPPEPLLQSAFVLSAETTERVILDEGERLWVCGDPSSASMARVSLRARS